MQEFKVSIAETRRKVILIAAENEEEAKQKAFNGWMDRKIVFSDKDELGFHAQISDPTDEFDEKRIERMEL